MAFSRLNESDSNVFFLSEKKQRKEKEAYHHHTIYDKDGHPRARGVVGRLKIVAKGSGEDRD